MKNAFLLMFFCLVPLLVVGQELVGGEENTERVTESQPAEPQPTAFQSAQPAPTPGHPLDPNDVAILTGHARGPASAAYSTPTIVYGYTPSYSYGYGPHFGFHGFFFPRSGRVHAPFFGSPFGPVFFTGFAAGPH